MNKKVLITGINGSAGSYFAEYLVLNQPDVEIHGISRWHSTSSEENIKGIRNKINMHECDLMDYSSIFSVLTKVQPDYIFHFASYANVRASFETPLAVLSNNVMGTANLLEAIKQSNTNPTFVLAGTPEIFGQADGDSPFLKEESPIKPQNIYAVSKTTQDLLAQAYFLNWGMRTIRTRPFSYVNPKRKDLFATAFAMQVARIEKGLQKVLTHGNLESRRNLIDVRDVMEAYWLAATKGIAGEAYNIGGDNEMSVGEFLERLKKMARCEIPTEVDPKLLRPVDLKSQLPDSSKFRRETGWRPKIPFDETLRYLLEHCRKEVDKEIISYS
jgi:GDPmannose 4,6-dehydratase/GDP-4-dehydro-6-deoxy-D-mannose reductase